MTAKIRRPQATWLGLFLCLIVAAAAGAQQGPDASASQPPDEQQQQAQTTDESQYDEVIVVTARRREEPIQTTPIAVTAISPEILEDRNVTDIEEITSITPNLKLDATTYSSTAARIYIRGIGQDDAVVTADPGVGLYIDGVYIGRAQATLQAINDVQRIEVLRGPQGTLFGRNTIGGAINIITALPDTAGFRGEAMIRGGDYNLVESRLSLNFPASDVFAARLSAASVDSDGFMTNAFDGGDRNDRGLLGGRLTLRANPSDSFSADLGIDYTDQNRKSAIGECLYTGKGGLVPVADNFFGFRQGCEATVLDNDPYLGASDFDDTDDSTSSGATLRLNWTGAKLSLQSISSYREADSELALDIDQSAVQYFDQVAKADIEQVSQELQLNGATDSTQYTFGLYYFTEDVVANDFTRALAQFPATPVIVPINNLNQDLFRFIDNESLAAYGQASFDLSDKLSLTAGARYTEESKDFALLSRLFLTNTIATDVSQTQDFDEVTGLVSLAYEFNDRVFGYASVSRGFKSGGFNGRTPPGSTSLEVFQPEFVNAYELGVKSTAAGGRVTVNGALYMNDYEDLQLTIFQLSPQGGFASVVRNAAQATVQGAEIEFRAFTGGGLQFIGHVGLIDAEYDEFFADINGDGAATDNSNLNFKHAPDYDYSLGIQYNKAVRNSDLLTLFAEVTGRDETFSNTANTPGTEITAYDLVNARFAYDFINGKVQASLWGKNLTDKTYTTTGLSFEDSLGFNIIIYAPPRSYGADLRFRF